MVRKKMVQSLYIDAESRIPPRGSALADVRGRPGCSGVLSALEMMLSDVVNNETETETGGECVYLNAAGPSRISVRSEAEEHRRCG